MTDVGRTGLADQVTARRWIGPAALWLAAAAVLATACSMLAGLLWIGEMAVHFRVQYAVAGLLASAGLAWARRPVWALVALAVAAANALIAAAVMGVSPARAEGAAAQSGTPLRVVSLNVLYGNRRHEAVIDFIRSESPDLAVLVEMTARWREALTALHEAYPYRFATHGPAGKGVLLLSRWPILHATEVPLEGDDEPAVAATLQVGSRKMHVLGVHTTCPATPGLTALRDRQLDRLGRLVSRMGTDGAPVVVLGDLNVSPFSPRFPALLEAGGLASAAEGFGWQPTWPTFLPPAGIQIDHVLITDGIAVQRFRRGPDVGSDHLPVVVDLVL